MNSVYVLITLDQDTVASEVQVFATKETLLTEMGIRMAETSGLRPVDGKSLMWRCDHSFMPGRYTIYTALERPILD